MVREIVSSSAATMALKWQEIERASRDDPEIQQVIEALDSGGEGDIPLPFKMISTELCRLDDVLLRVDRIVIPQSLRQRVLQIAHEGHPGIRIMKSHLRTNSWWPKMDQDVERYVKACRGCVLVSAPNQPEPMIRKTLPSRPWEQIAIDFLGPLPDGENLLVCIDYYSRFMEVIEMNFITSASTIKELLIIFSRYGVPESIRADNGPQFSSDEFQAFCDEYGIHLETTIPYWPQMNGEVERQNRSILKRLRIAQELGKDWRKDLRQYLLVYHSSNHSTTGKAPAELMFGRKMRTKLPSVPINIYDDEEMREKDKIEKEKGRVYADKRRKAEPSTIEVGDKVVAKRIRKNHKLQSNFSPEEFSVIGKHGTDVTIRSSLTGKEFRRSAAHLKQLPTPPIQESQLNKDAIDPSCQQDSLEMVDPKPGQSRILHHEDPVPKRTRMESTRLREFVTY
ncbi:uncharacterized protein K02A2.6-like [Toxorhynchites rutilus septentrionalis]|uniref:uncharacterized protein K02A2.6-like n=1 Tax=Toxorhynchites rutilus septentrionalis TaxID=329112 RepID=UPI0024795080|nr:uncharacterized protein K02A2.6-like [Toxorhynchites rutilus septentrionalis]